MSMSKIKRRAHSTGTLGKKEPRKKAVGRVLANVLSKTNQDGLVVLYSGVVDDYYAKADGTINNLVLRYARKGLVNINDADFGKKSVDLFALARDPESSNSFLVLTSADISNIFFEEEAVLTTSLEGLEKLKVKVRESEANKNKATVGNAENQDDG